MNPVFESGDKRLRDVLGAGPHVLPEAACGDGEAAVLGEGGELVVAVGFGQSVPVLREVYVGDPLEKHQREDVCLEVRLVDGSAQQVGGLLEVLLQLAERQ